MKIVTVTLPASWASAMVNEDWSGLEYDYPEEAQRAKDWLRESGLSVLSCGDHTFVERIDGILTECMEYQCVERK